MNKINSEYFKFWTNRMAYILGFITADGGMHYHGYNGLKGEGYKLSINLKYEDKSILHFIRDEIAPNNKIYERRFGKPLKSTGLQRHQASLVISSKIMMDDLINLGITPQKTGNEILPHIPEQYKSDYLRGIFDGDGCLFVGTQKCKMNCKTYGLYSLKIVSANKNFLSNLKEKVAHGLGGNISLHPPNCYKWDTRNKNGIIELCKFMYYDGFPFALQRKYDKFIQLLET